MERAILVGPCIGELYWELARFAPHALYLKKKDRNIKLIVLTREDRFDIYGSYAHILVPLRIDGDGSKYKPDCFRLLNFPFEEYKRIVKKFSKKYSKRFQITKHIYPKIERRMFLRREQFPRGEMLYKFSPRKDNRDLVEKYIPQDKPIVVLGPRFRKGFKRNWNGWEEFYNLLSSSKLMKSFNFVICGKPGEYIPDHKNRFYDINLYPVLKIVH